MAVLLTGDPLVDANIKENSPDWQYRNGWQSLEKRNAAVDILWNTLKSGPAAGERILRGAKARGFSKRTLNRARDQLGVRLKKIDFDGGYVWVWFLPYTALNYIPQGVMEARPVRARERIEK